MTIVRGVNYGLTIAVALILQSNALGQVLIAADSYVVANVEKSQSFIIESSSPQVVHIAGSGVDLAIEWLDFSHESSSFSPNDEWILVPAGSHELNVTAKYVEPKATFEITRTELLTFGAGAASFFELTNQASRLDLEDTDQRSRALILYLQAEPSAPDAFYQTLVRIRIADIYRRDSKYAEGLKVLTFTPHSEFSQRVLIERGSLHSMLGQHAEANERFCEVLLLADKRKQCTAKDAATLDRSTEAAAAANYLGLVAHKTGDLELATRWYEVVNQVNPIGGILQAALTLNNLGGVSFVRGDIQQSIERFSIALGEYERLEDVHYRRTLEGNLALAHIQLGQFEESLQRYVKALDLCRLEHWLECEGVQLTSISNFYLEIGEYKQAQRYASQAIEARAAGGLPAAADANLLLGKALREQGQLEEAAKQLEIALGIAVQEQSRRHQIGALIELSQNALLLREFPDMEGYANQAVPLAKQLGDRVALGELYRLLGVAATNRGAIKTSLTMFAKALDSHGKGNASAISTRYEWASALVEDGDPAGALSQLSHAVAHIERSRGTISNTKLRAFYTSRQLEVVGLQLKLLVKSGKVLEALSVALRNRNRSMLDAILNFDANERPAGLRHDISLLKRQFAAKREAKDRLALRPAAALAVAQIESELAEIAVRLDAAESQFVAGGIRAAIDPKAVQSGLGDGVLLLVHYLQEDGGWQWAVRRDSVQLHRLPGTAALDQMVGELHDRIRTRSWKLEDGDSLSQTFFGHVDLSTVDEVLIMGDGATSRVPYGVLRANAHTEQPLAANTRFNTLPYLMSTVPTKSASSRKGALVVSDPVYGGRDRRLQGQGPSSPLKRLHHTAKEAHAITQLLSTEKYVVRNLQGFEATKAAFQKIDFAELQVLHVATHGIVDLDHLELSGIWLGAVSQQLESLESLLSVGEIYDMSIDVPLVVLSACDTASGTQIHGEGTMSLSRAFFVAGASQVVSTNWPVTDRATAEFMQAFYKSWLTNHDAGSAVQAAQQQMMSSGRWSNPLYWGGFIASTAGR